jgi:hypothetical protein
MNDFFLNASIVGLNTFSFIVPNAGPYVLSGKLSIPTVTNGGGSSSVVVTVQQNSSTKYTGTAGADGFKTVLSCAAGDSLAIIMSSSNPDDEGLNAIKANISCSQGVA